MILARQRGSCVHASQPVFSKLASDDSSWCLYSLHSYIPLQLHCGEAMSDITEWFTYLSLEGDPCRLSPTVRWLQKTKIRFASLEPIYFPITTQGHNSHLSLTSHSNSWISKCSAYMWQFSSRKCLGDYGSDEKCLIPYKVGPNWSKQISVP